jgi:hypothetical protein
VSPCACTMTADATTRKAPIHVFMASLIPQSRHVGQASFIWRWSGSKPVSTDRRGHRPPGQHG